ncbi:MAG: hypothetical protein LBS15_03580 [Endomicrobium sp.]|nr:hypothetical protein [Endomicrobium sp.]
MAYTLIISLVGLLFLCFAKIFILPPFIQGYVRAQTGCNCAFDNFCISPFNLIIENVTIDDDVVSMQKVRFELDPVKYLAHIVCPVIFVNHVDISKLKISVNKNHKNRNFFYYLKDGTIKFPKSEISMFVDEILIKRDINFLKILNTNILVKPDHISLDFIAFIFDIPINFSSHIRQVTSGVLNISSIITLKDKVNMIVNLDGKINLSSLSVNQSIVIEKFEFCSKLKNRTRVPSEVDVSKINKNICRNNLSFGELNIKEVFNSNIMKINLGVLSFNLDDFSLLGTNDNSKVCNLKYVYAPEKKIEITYCKNGNYKLKLIFKNRVVGMIIGNIKTGKIVANLMNINIEDIPIIPFLFRDIKGIISIFGLINITSGRIDFKFEKLSLSNVNLRNIYGNVTRNNNVFFFDFFKDDNSSILKAVVDNNKMAMANFNFNDINISEIFCVYRRLAHKVNGKISGNINYKKNTLTKFNIKAFDMTLYGNKLKEIEVSGDMDFSKININRFILRDASGKLSIDATGMVLFRKALNISSVYVNMKNIYIGGVTTTGCLRFQNSLNSNKKIKGIIRGNNIKILGVPFRSIVANAAISSGKFEIFNLRSDNGLKGDLWINFKKNKLSGNIYFKNTNIQGVYPGIYGLLSSVVKFSGKLNNPCVNIRTSLIKGKYLSNHFFLSSKLAYKNGIVTFYAMLFSNKTKITIKRNYLRNDTFSLTVNNLTEKIINMFSDFKVPINGYFSGDGIFTVVNGRYNCKMALKAKDVYIEGLRLNDIKFDIEIGCDAVRVSNVSAKILDSEIKVDKGFFNIESGRYGFNLSLLNIHVGPIDLFGNLKLFGKIKRDNKGSVYHSGMVDLSSLWINGCHLFCSHFGYTINGKVLEFSNKADNSDLYNCSGLVILNESMPVKKFNILKGKTSFDLNVNSLGDYIDLKAKCSKIDWNFITNILNLPISIEGSADVNISLLGNISNPKGDITIASTEGAIMKVPYDNFNAEISFLNNIVILKKVVIGKLNEVSVYVRGSLPFWFNKTLINKAKKKSIDIFYDIEDNKLSILKYLSKGFIKSNSGKMLLKGSLTGTYKKLNNNAKLSIVRGSFELKNYINKVRDMCVEMSIDENLIKINKFNFRAGQGILYIDGQIGVNNFSIKDFDIRFFTDNKGIHLSVTQLPINSSKISSKYLLQDYSVGDPCFDIKMQGTTEKSKICGYVLLKNTRFTFPGNISCKNKNFIFLKNTEFDLELKASENTKFENSFISALIRGSVFVKGFYKNIKVKGIIESSNGIVDYLGYGFSILNAKMEIIDGGQIYVTADCKTTGNSKMGNESKNMKLTIPRCNLSDLRFYLNYDDLKKKIGKTIKTEQYTKSNLLDFKPFLDFRVKRQALRIIDQNVVTPFARTVLRKAGLVDNLKVSYAQVDSITSIMDDFIFAKLFFGAKYSMEKNITDRILIGYSIIFDEFGKKLDLHHDIEIKYKIVGNLFVSYRLDIGKWSNPQSDVRLALQCKMCF